MVRSDTMIGAPERPGLSGVKEALRSRRFIKHLAHEEDITLVGARGQRLDRILNVADQVLLQLEIEHADWIREKRQSFASYLSPVKSSVVEEKYKSGLVTTITQEFRTYGRVSKGETVKLDDPDYLKGVITAYTFDFLRSLRLSQRIGINPNTALEVARLSYHYNPEKLMHLIRKYPDINLSAILTAALNYPKDPEAFLDGFILTVERLTQDERYKALPESVIDRAARDYPKDPEAFLDGFILTVERLTKKYPDIASNIITKAALFYPSNPETVIEKS